MIALRMLVAGACLAAGVVLADRAAPPPRWALAAGLGGAACLAGAWAVHRGRPPPTPGEAWPGLQVVPLALVLAGTAGVGFADAGVRSAALRRGAPAPEEARAVTLRGTVWSDPAPAGGATAFLLRARSVDGHAVRRTVAVRVHGGMPAMAFGDRVMVGGRLRGLDPADPFDERLRRRWVWARAAAVGSELRILARSRNPVLRAAGHVRGRMRAMARASANRGGAPLLLGLVLGDERGIPEEVRDDFRASGLAHLLAVSGANVAIVLAVAGVALRALGVPRRAQVGAGLALVAFFAVVTRWEPSVLRAAFMASLGLGAFLAGRTYSPLHGLGAAFTGLVAFDPFLLWSVGFRLSFAATAGILLLGPPLRERLAPLPRALREAIAVGTAAQLAVAPLLAVHAGRLSAAALPANLGVMPLVAPVTALGVVAAALGSAWEPLGRPFFRTAAAVASWIGWVAHAFARVPGASIPAPDLTPRGLVAAYLLLGAAGAWAAGRRRPAAVILTLALALGGSGLLPVGPGPPEAGILRLTFLDVGQGDAALVESSGGAVVLVDGGPDPGRVARILRRRGVDRVDVAVFTHPHADHVTGLRGVAGRLSVRMVLHPGTDEPAVAALGAPPVLARPGLRLVAGDLAVDVLGPDDALRAAALAPGTSAGEGTAVNDASVVLRVAWGEECALFPGDLEEEGQRALVASAGAAVACTVLKAPHHGSARLLPEFVAAVDPEWVAVSVGPNDYGHPSRRALRLFDAAGARVLRTDHLGDVELEMGRDGATALRD